MSNCNKLEIENLIFIHRRHDFFTTELVRQGKILLGLWISFVLSRVKMLYSKLDFSPRSC